MDFDRRFSFSHSQDADTTVLSLAGELDLTVAAQLRRLIDGLMQAPGAHVVDMTAVTFLDSAALAALIANFRSSPHLATIRFIAPVERQPRRLLHFARIPVLQDGRSGAGIDSAQLTTTAGR